MPIFEIKSPLHLEAPSLVVAVSGWVDAGLVATKIGEYLGEDGQVVAQSRSDEAYDYRSNRPMVHFADGGIAAVEWPRLSLTALAGQDLLVLTGPEPDSRWEEASQEIAHLAEAAQVRRVVAVGAIGAAVAHTRPTPIMITSTDPDIEPSGVPLGSFSVPGAFVNIVSHHVATANGIPEIGFWAQVPHYVSGAYWPGVEAMLVRLEAALGLGIDTTETAALANEMRHRLDEAVSQTPAAREFVQRLEELVPGFEAADASGLAEEIEAYLRQAGDDQNPFN